MNYYSEEVHGPHEMFELGNFELESGITLPDARLAFKTQGHAEFGKGQRHPVPAYVVRDIEVDGDLHR